MRRLIQIFSEQKLFGDLLTIFIIGLGLYSLTLIRRELFPNIAFDVIEVATLYPGASAAEIERLVTNPLEQDLKEVDGVKKMTSQSVEGRSAIFLELDINSTVLEKAKSDIRDIVDKITPDLPEQTQRPTVKSLETKEGPVIEVTVSGTLPALELRAVARRMEKEIEKVPGVAGVDLIGTEDREFQVHARPEALSKFRISLEELTGALSRQNVSIPGGFIDPGPATEGRELAVRTSGQLVDLKSVADTVIKANELGRAIHVRDVATVTEGLARPTVLSHTDGIPSIRLTVRQKERVDVIDLVDAVRAKVESLRPTLEPGVSLALVNDASEYVRRRLGVLFGNFTIGLGLVLVFLPLFLPFRFALLVAVGEPFAFLGALLVFQAMDVGLNLISVVGLILVSGILVDDGIVVVENVARLIREKGMAAKDAAILGAQQVWLPIFASAATTIVAFLPMANMSGIFGKFVGFIPLGVIIPIIISLFENFFIMPHHVGTWLRPQDFDLQAGKGIFAFLRRKTDEWWENGVMPRYLRVLRGVVHYRYLILFVALPALVGGALFLAVKVMKVVLFPPEGVEIFVVRVDAPNGSGLDATRALVRKIEAGIAKLGKDELQNTLALIGLQQQEVTDPLTRRGSEFGQVMVFLTPEEDRTRTAQEIMDGLRRDIGVPEGASHIAFERINTGPPVGKPISIGVRGESYDALLAPAKELKEIVKTVSGVTDITDSYLLGKKQVNVDVNAKEAAAAGLTLSGIGNTVRAAYEGLVATAVRTLDEKVDVRVSLSPDEKTSREALQHLKVLNQQGYLVPLSAVATFSESQELAARAHENNQREVRVFADVDPAVKSATEANAEVRGKLGALAAKFPGVSFHFGGEDQDTQESLASLGRAFGLAILAIFLILVLTFRTFFQPLVVLITIPLGLISVVLTFFVHGLPFSFLGMVGMVGLSGIIVNNAIVFVEFVNEARREGLSAVESLIEAARRRARPIFLTSVTTSIGILPTAYGLGGTDKFVVPIAMAMGWGLTIGAVLTLFVLPAALAALDDTEALTKRLFRVGRRAA